MMNNMQFPNIQQMKMEGMNPGSEVQWDRHHGHHHGGYPHHHHGGNFLPGAGFIAGGLLGSALGGQYPHHPYYPNIYYPYMNQYPYYPYMQNPNVIYTTNPM